MAGEVPVINPWLPQSRPSGGSNGKSLRSVQELSTGLTGPLAPQGAGVPRPDRALPVARPRPGTDHGWWWLGVHGGAGVTTLERAVPGGRDAGLAWPVSVESPSVVLVARSGANGIEAAQNAARQWASGMVPGVDLLGLVVVADAPGRRPRVLQNLVRLVSGAVPRLWEVPWVEPWRLGESPTEHLPKECAPLARDLSRLTRPA
ncbi:DUF6668 family protein [Streptomyces sp. NPDC058470]|uniref:DUF6668 family protein n=1 Tax=unclassified Streptomyces TaxID=2593676 RepID=UPI003659FED9